MMKLNTGGNIRASTFFLPVMMTFHALVLRISNKVWKNKA